MLDLGIGIHADDYGCAGLHDLVEDDYVLHNGLAFLVVPEFSISIHLMNGLGELETPRSSHFENDKAALPRFPFFS